MSRMQVHAALAIAVVGLASSPYVHAQTTQAAEPRVLFIGLWDRAFQHMAKASEAAGLPVRMLTVGHSDSPDEASEELRKTDYARYDLIYVLQVDQVEAHALADLLKRAKEKNRTLRIVQLDQRGTQQELIDKGLLEIDPQVRAYWRGWSVENLTRLLNHSRIKYLGGTGEIPEAVPALASGLYHPDAPEMLGSWSEYQDWYGKRAGYDATRPLVAVFIQQDYVAYGNHQVYDALVRALEKRGVRVAAMFGSQKDLQRMLRECKPSLLMLQHHSGPEDMPEAGQKSFLEELNVPYIYSAGMMSGITVEEWQDDVRGTRMGGYAQLSRHEMYGIIEPFLIGARASSAYGFALDEPIEERVNRVADRVRGWLRLQQTPVQDKKVAIIYFHKYLGKADIGRPAPEMSRYLDPHASLLELLRAMSKAGYRTGSLPSSSSELLELMKKGGRNVPAWAPGEMADVLAQGDPVLLPAKQYEKWYEGKLAFPTRAEVEKVHGAAPGKFMVTRRDGAEYIVLPCIRFGNVMIAPQPDRGSLQDGDLVHSRTAPPPHNYLAFYWWLQEEFGAQAMVHFGTHGSEFYLPGKELFLSGDCFPDAIVGSMPNFDVWTIQNIGEAVISKRRSYAVIVDHGVPPIVQVSRDAQANDLLDLIDSYGSATAAPMKEAIARELAETVRTSTIAAELKMGVEPGKLLTEAQIDTLSAYLRHVTTNTVVKGMHVLGVAPKPEDALPFVEHIVARNTDLHKKLQAAGCAAADDPQQVARGLFEAILIKNVDPGDAAKQLGLPEATVTQTLVGEIQMAKQAWSGLAQTGDEITNLLAGLEGKYVPPGPGGDPILRPDALPTGRNLYGLAPQEVPTRLAWDLACRTTDEFLAKFQKENGRYPEKLAFTMTGMETFRNMGVMEAQILYLLGVRPEWSPGKLISGLQLIPREKLGRPRVDVVMSVNGIYLKDFAPCVRLLDEAVQIAVASEEADNAVRLHALKIEGDLRNTGVSADRAKQLSSARIIGSEAGGGGARLVWFLPRSGTWQDRKEIVDLWRAMRTHVYTGKLWGEKLPDLHEKVFAGTEGVITSWSDNLLSPLTNHHYPEETGGLAMSVEWINGKKSPVSVFDLRQREKSGATSLEEVLSLELRSVAFNPEWIRGQMEHGYAGASQFMQIVDNSFQWEAVRQGAVWPGAWDQMVNVYVRDSLGLGLRGWFDTNNPFAFQELTATLLEAARKGYWAADSETVRELVVAHAGSVSKYGHGAGPYAGGNQGLRGLLVKTLDRPGDEALKKAYLEKMDRAEQASGKPGPARSGAAEQRVPPAAQQVVGQQMEPVKEPSPAANPAQQPLGPWLLYGSVGLAAIVLVFVGYRLRIGMPKR